MDSHQAQDERVERANALYWESDRSVNHIADQMEISKGMLYGLIRPLTVGLPCPRCSSDMEYTNRTARERGFLTCSGCGLDGEADEVRASWLEAAAATPEGKLLVTPPAAEPRAGGIPPERWLRDPVMVGAGLLLVAAGIWLVEGLRRR